MSFKNRATDLTSRANYVLLMNVPYNVFAPWKFYIFWILFTVCPNNNNGLFCFCTESGAISHTVASWKKL